MCWIAIVRGKKRLCDILSNQVDRWLEGMGVITPKVYYRALYTKLKHYLSYIKNCIAEDSIYILHHRKASLGAICFDNVHPFEGEKFILVQNWTIRNFYKTYKDIYRKETDTATLHAYLEEKASCLWDIPIILKELSETHKEDFGIVIIKSRIEGKILFYADGSRESYIDINTTSNTINSISNYDNNSWFENTWYMVLSYKGVILESTFEDLNKKEFYLYISWIQRRKNAITRTYYGEGWKWDYITQSYKYNPPKEKAKVDEYEKERERIRIEVSYLFEGYKTSDMYRIIWDFLQNVWEAKLPTEINAKWAFIEWFYNFKIMDEYKKYQCIMERIEWEFHEAFKITFNK